MKAGIQAVVRSELDRALIVARPAVSMGRPAAGWVNAIRRAIGMTERQLADRLGIAQSSVHGLERSEAIGTIRLDTLRRAAAALDCEVAYVLIPRVSLNAIVEERARAIAYTEIARARQTMSLEGQDVLPDEAALDARVRELIAGRGLWRGQ
jgi:predicted DNA-binding mobile mystery protein A